MAERDADTIHSERRAHYDAAPEVIWASIEQLPQYRSWWPWLRRFDAGGLADGERWTCTVRPPLPYQVSFELLLHDVVPARSVAATIDGDIAGTARIELAPAGGGTDLTLVAEVRAASAFLRRLDRLAGPVARYGHDHIIDKALAQFADHAL